MAVSAGCAIVAAVREDRPGYAFFKPLTTFVVLLGAAFLLRPAPPLYRGLVVLGLALSLAGDLLLLVPRRFALGLGAFLLAHLAYLAAFSLSSPLLVGQVVWLVPYVAAGFFTAGYVWSGLGKLRIPVAIYVAVIAVTAWRAAMRLGSPAIPHASAACAAAGAALFLASDALLAVRRFRHAFRCAQAVELALYWAGQFLIAMSVRG